MTQYMKVGGNTLEIDIGINLFGEHRVFIFIQATDEDGEDGEVQMPLNVPELIELERRLAIARRELEEL